MLLLGMSKRGGVSLMRSRQVISVELGGLLFQADQRFINGTIELL